MSVPSDPLTTVYSSCVQSPDHVEYDASISLQTNKEQAMGPIPNRYTELVGIDHPIVQEGLGPFRTPRLAAAVSNAGGLGTVSMPGMPEDLEAGARTFRAHIEECASLTDRPFAVNIPVGVDGSGK